MLGKQLTTAAAGNAGGGAGLYVEDVFSTYLYTGTSGVNSIDNGIDLSGEGGMVWVKNRDLAERHSVFDTERGTSSHLATNEDSAARTRSFVQSFDSDGFTLNTSDGEINSSSYEYCSWTFRKAPGFFDVITYTGDGTTGRTISHNLGSTPGMIWIKKTSGTNEWAVWHANEPSGYDGQLNTTQYFGFSYITGATSSDFTITYAGNPTNQNGESYVAYVFASDDQRFGENADEAIIKCGHYTGNGSSAGPQIDLGFEPQFLLVKQSSMAGANWVLVDNMRNLTTDGKVGLLYANTTNTETATNQLVARRTSGFQPAFSGYEINQNVQDYVYMAIRRPHKAPTAGTEVFALQASRATGNGDTDQPTFTSGFPVDLLMQPCRAGNNANATMIDRLRGGGVFLKTNSTDTENTTSWRLDSSTGAYISGGSTATTDFSGCMWRRAPGFFDIVGYTGNGGQARTIAHNLGVAPEMIWVKGRDVGESWTVGASDWTKYLLMNNTDAAATWNGVWNDTAPTDSHFTIHFGNNVNQNGNSYIAYLFASIPGICKIGTYTGTGSAQDIDCGFTSGARFVMIKCISNTSNWCVWDTARGINTGNDPLITLNTTDAEITTYDWIDPLSSGFSLTSASFNGNGFTFLYYAIA